jgi:predicted peptidase
MTGVRQLLLLLAACGSGAAPLSDASSSGDGGVDARVDAFIDYGDAGPSSLRQVKRPIGTTTAGNGYLEYLPPGYGNGDRWPLLVFWHGIGEDGSGSSADLDRVANAGPPHLIQTDQWPPQRPFVVLSPQNDVNCPDPGEVKAFIDYAKGAYEIDPDRVYLTGLSCGAIGSWNYMGSYVDLVQLAAFVPIAGDGSSAWSQQGCDLGKVATWAFHGDSDPVVNIGGDNTAMNGLAGCSATQEIKYTVYPGVGHDSWSMTYDLSAGHDIYTWMLSKTRVP